jgi:hypothetical protein
VFAGIGAQLASRKGDAVPTPIHTHDPCQQLGRGFCLILVDFRRASVMNVPKGVTLSD